MIVLHLLQLYSVKSQNNAAMSTGVKSSVNYYRKWTLISFEVGEKLKNRENLKFSKKIKLWSKFTGRTCVRLRAPLILFIAMYDVVHLQQNTFNAVADNQVTCIYQYLMLYSPRPPV